VACHIPLESSRWRLKLCFEPHFNQRSSKEVMCLQNYRNPNFENFETSKLRVLGQNDIWVHAPWPNIENIIRRKVVASPKSRLWWVLWICVCMWFIYAPKVLQLCTNQLVVWFVHVYVIIDLLVVCLTPHSGVPAHPFILKMLRAKEHTQFFILSLFFTFGFIVESIKEFGGASTWIIIKF